MTPEGRVKERVKKLLKHYNAWYCMPVAGPYGRNGVPDIIGCYRGRFFCIETKAGRNKATELQTAQMVRVTEAGGVSFLINEHNMDELELWLQGLSA